MPNASSKLTFIKRPAQRKSDNPWSAYHAYTKTRKTGQERPRINLMAGTPNTENSTIFPCTDDISVRVTPTGQGNSLYYIDFVHATEGSRVNKPGFAVYSNSCGRFKQHPWGVRPTTESPLDIYVMHSKDTFEICSAADDQTITKISFIATPIAVPAIPGPPSASRNIPEHKSVLENTGGEGGTLIE